MNIKPSPNQELIIVKARQNRGPTSRIRMHPPKRRGVIGQLALLMPLVWFFGLAVTQQAEAVFVHHHLSVRMDPAAQRLSGTDRMKIRPQGAEVATFFLAPHTRLDAVTVDSKPVPLDMQKSGWLQVPLGSGQSSRTVSVTIKYEAVFNDRFPIKPLNVDNPGYGVVGTIGEQGALLLAGAGWYPMASGGRETFLIEVKAPKGMVAVTAGASEGVDHRGAYTISRWRVQHPIDGLALSVGRYLITKKELGHVTAATYFFPQSNHLAATYLDAVEGYLKLYESLFGPYPFEKFAVVENFFPTGYGFPSYTLLGSRVLQLPFIVRTSLGHEIAHCWWGNSVYIDSSEGNWAEGLTTYVADYLYKERTSAAAALEYRRQMLRNYATLVSPEADFPLSEFRSRTDPVTRAIGYDKAAFVFHMLRRQLGEDHFWGGLRDVYRSKLFKRASWSDFQTAFENRADRSLEKFFRQWVHRKGAPRLALQGVARERTGAGWRVAAIVHQSAPVYDGLISVQVDSEEGRQVESIRLSGAQTEFVLHLTSEPQRLSVDAGMNFFRRLDSTEIPPTINALKAARSVVVVFADPGDAAAKSAADTLAVSLGLNIVGEVEGSRFAQERRLVDRHDLLFIGFPGREEVTSARTGLVSLNRGRFEVAGDTFTSPGDTFFGVFPHPRRKDRVAAVFMPLSNQDHGRVARKITHYGKYSYLVFNRGNNRVKGYWPINQSPLIHKWQSKGES